MTGIVTLSKSLETLVSEATTYINDNNIDEPAMTDPFNPCIDLGDPIALIENIPSLGTLLSDMELTPNTVTLYTAYPVEIFFALAGAYLIIPVKNFSEFELRRYELKSGATSIPDAKLSEVPCYTPESGTKVESIQIAQDSVYAVNKDVYHSFYSDAPRPWILSKNAGEFLVVFVNEDISSYFA